MSVFTDSELRFSFEPTSSPAQNVLVWRTAQKTAECVGIVAALALVDQLAASLYARTRILTISTVGPVETFALEVNLALLESARCMLFSSDNR